MKKTQKYVSKEARLKEKRKRRGKILIWIGLIAIIGSVLFGTMISLYGYFNS